jgi:hypothetical protein
MAVKYPRIPENYKSSYVLIYYFGGYYLKDYFNWLRLFSTVNLLGTLLLTVN